MTATFLRFSDLKRRRIVSNWPTPLRWIEQEDFPVGRYLGPNSRVWTCDEIEAWLAARPTPRRRQAEAAAEAV